MSAIVKKKRVSKKNKSAWRKHTDVKDIEEFLEEQRQEERIGSFTDKKDEELFHVDTTEDKKLLLSASEKRKANAKKSKLKSLISLENTSKVEDPIVKRNFVKLKKTGRNLEQEILNPKSQRHIQANKDRNRYNEKLDKQVSRDKIGKVFQEDLWEDKDLLADYPQLKSQWCSKPLSLYTMTNLGKPIVKVHDSIRHKTIKTSKKFEAPHPGTSYNPSLKDHEDLLRKICEKEATIIKEEKHLKRVTTQMFSKMTPEDRDFAQLKELASGISKEEGGIDNSDDEDDEGNSKTQVVKDDDAPYTSVNPAVLNKKKDKKARRKQKEQKILSEEQKSKKAAKKQLTDLHRLRALNTDVLEEEEEHNELLKHRKKVAYQKKFNTKRLGKLKFKEADLDVNMADDIAGNLRNVKTESSLLVDRFKTLQKRNILPTSVDVGTHKRHKVKRFVRSSHKAPEKPLPKKK